MDVLNELRKNLRDVPDFPKPGILFKDITPVLQNPTLSNALNEEFYQTVKHLKIDAVLGIESRGFLFGFPLAMKLNVPFVIVRKSGKLPAKTISASYELEYGNATIEVHTDSIKKDWNVLIHDDLLATGGTAAAAAELVRKQDAKIAGYAFLIELKALNGRNKLKNISENIISLVQY